MASIPKDSLERLLFLRRELDRVFRDFFEPQRRAEGEHELDAEVSVDVFDTPEAIIIEAELPGLRREDIELSVLRDIVIIEGSKPRPASPSDSRFLCVERSFGKFRRVVEIPGAGDTRQIKAHYDRGVMTISLPKIHERRGQRRKVSID
jgi:HSP20 family protein